MVSNNLSSNNCIINLRIANIYIKDTHYLQIKIKLCGINKTHI